MKKFRERWHTSGEFDIVFTGTTPVANTCKPSSGPYCRSYKQNMEYNKLITKAPEMHDLLVNILSMAAENDDLFKLLDVQVDKAVEIIEYVNYGEED